MENNIDIYSEWINYLKKSPNNEFLSNHINLYEKGIYTIEDLNQVITTENTSIMTYYSFNKKQKIKKLI